MRRSGVSLLVLSALVAVPLLVSTEYGAAFGSAPDGARLERMQGSPQYRENAFVNSRPTEVVGLSESGSVFQEWLFGEQERTPSITLPVVASAETIARAPESGLRVTWLGHSTMLLEIEGLRILTDPVFANRASPSRWIGPARFHPVPVSVKELGRLDAVLISHDHYDHLDMASIRELAQSEARFFVPLGVGAHLERWDVSAARIEEHDWWQESKLGNLRLVATPAQHFSGRSLFDANRTLWASWTLLGSKHRVFFSGDTGLSPEFGAIGKRFGPFDLAMLEIGAYHPKWGDIHLGPKQALVALSQLRGKKLLPVHWGTFNLAFHAWMEPAETLYAFAQKSKTQLLTPRIGESLEPTVLTRSTNPWWREISPAPKL